MDGLLAKPSLAPKRGEPRAVTEVGPRPRADRPLCCAKCGARVTSQDDRIEVGGLHEHTCVNPAGIVYRIGCFREAPGCAEVGGESAYWSWFPGYTWQIVVCAACTEHLGWRFRADDSTFWGLILARLAEPPAE